MVICLFNFYLSKLKINIKFKLDFLDTVKLLLMVIKRQYGNFMARLTDTFDSKYNLIKYPN